MTSLKKVMITIDNPYIDPEFMDEFYSGDYDWAYQGEVLERVREQTQGLTRLTYLTVDNEVLIGYRYDDYD